MPARSPPPQGAEGGGRHGEGSSNAIHGTRPLAGNFKKMLINRAETQTASNAQDTRCPSGSTLVQWPKYRLIYFNVRARAEIARLMFAYMKVPYEDVRLNETQWAAFKEETMFGQLPVLEVDGELLSQSAAINRYLAKQFGLTGDTPMESAKIDMFCCWVEDFVRAVRPWIINASRQSADAPAQLVELKPKAVAPFIEKLMKCLATSGDYLMGAKPTLADFILFHVLETFVMLDDSNTFLSGHSELADGYLRRFGELPGVKEWIAKRPCTRI